MSFGFDGSRVDRRRSVLDLLEEVAMSSLGLTLIRLEGEEAQNSAKVCLRNIGARSCVFVSDLSQCTHCVLGGLHVIRRESLVAHRDCLDNGN